MTRNKDKMRVVFIILFLLKTKTEQGTKISNLKLCLKLQATTLKGLWPEAEAYKGIQLICLVFQLLCSIHNAAFEVFSNNRSASSSWHVLLSITRMLYVLVHTVTEELQLTDDHCFFYRREAHQFSRYNLVCIVYYSITMIFYSGIISFNHR